MTPSVDAIVANQRPSEALVGGHPDNNWDDPENSLDMRDRSLGPGSPTITVVVAAPSALTWPALDDCFSQPAGYSLVRCRPDLELMQAACATGTPCVSVVDMNLAQTVLFRAGARGSLVAPVLVLTGGSKVPDELLERLVCAGCLGFLSHLSVPILRRAVRAVAMGELWVSRRFLSGLLRRLISESTQQLTGREAEILRLKQAGASNQQIAAQLFISKETVRWHIRHLNQKRGAQPNGAPARESRPRDDGSERASMR